MNLILPRGYLDRSPYHKLDGLEAMAILFLHTEANILGMVHISHELFSIKSGINHSVLESALSKIPDHITQVSENHYWIRRMILDQHGGTIHSMVRHRMFGNIIKALALGFVEPLITQLVLQEYPILIDAYLECQKKGEAPPFRTGSNKDWYRDVYLKSDHWTNLRESAIQKHGSVCSSCGSTNNIQVHHLRYSNLYDVTVDDLQILCRPCHFREHTPPKPEPDPDDSYEY